MSSKHAKIEAHASHLLDAFIELRHRYALLGPMLFEEDVPRRWGSGRRAHGFAILRHTLFLSCCQDIAKLTMDSDGRTPSLRNLMAELADDDLRSGYRDQFATWKLPPVDEEADPAIAAALRQIETDEERELRHQFDTLYDEAVGLWQRLSVSVTMNGFRTIRDKVTAHTEVRHVADKYELVDIAKLGIKWGDLRTTIQAMQRLVAILGMLIRNAGFAWDSLDVQLTRASAGFWE